ncbi:MAG: hypothetical protein ABIA63_11525, partial [bacterium]
MNKRIFFLLIFSFLIILFLSHPILAELKLITPEAVTLKTSPIITFGYIVQVIISLAIIIGLIYLSGKYLMPRLQFTSTGKNIEVIERAG